MEPEYVVVGEVLKPQGLRGEVKVRPLTDWPERFAGVEALYLSRPGERRRCLVEQSRVGPPFVFLKLHGIDSRSDAEGLRGALVEVERADAVELPAGSYYMFQIVGLTVALENGSEIGRVTEVMRTGSNDVYVVERDGHPPALIPAIGEVVRAVNLEEGRLIVRPLPGLL